MATDQPTGARYPAAVALLRRERASAETDLARCSEKVRWCEDTIGHIRSREKPRLRDDADAAWWERNAAIYRDLLEQRESLVRQIDAALAALAGEGSER